MINAAVKTQQYLSFLQESILFNLFRTHRKRINLSLLLHQFIIELHRLNSLDIQ